MGCLLSTTTGSIRATVINKSDADVTVLSFTRSAESKELAKVEPHKQLLITIPCESFNRTHEIHKLRFQIMKDNELIGEPDIKINGLDRSPDNLTFVVDPVSYIVQPGQHIG